MIFVRMNVVEMRKFVQDNKLFGYVNNELKIETQDKSNTLNYGGMGLIAEDGTICTNEVQVS